MKANIKRSNYIPDIPSASGIEIIANDLYIIGDDSLFFYHTDLKGNIKERIPLADNASTIRISKPDKPDFEAITSLYIDNKLYLLVIGSGSIKYIRENAKLVNPITKQVETISLTSLYSCLKIYMPIEDQLYFNIEGLCSSDTHLYFAQRGNITGHQIIFKLFIKDFISYCKKPTTDLNITSYTFSLPEINGIKFGLSACCFDEYNQKILFCAAAENTQNTYDDGLILGSLIGIISFDEVNKTVNIMHTQVILKKKIESLCILKKDDHTNYTLLAVCDNDNEASELLEILLSEN